MVFACENLCCYAFTIYWVVAEHDILLSGEYDMVLSFKCKCKGLSEVNHSSGEKSDGLE